ncbi:MAG: hypothetical protein QOG88_1552 [Actinomycetota bacterium]|nr:hypothetical protein [Actinomycetota bacterium]
MRPDRRSDGVVTPEGIPLSLDVAGLGSRAIALGIDWLIQIGITIVVVWVLSGVHVEGTAAGVIIAVFFFFVFWGYFFVFEGLWHGQTPGKRTQRLRVVRADGHPMGGARMFVRNLLRIVDFFPLYNAVGVISILATRRSQRVGDLAAGTIVIREPKPEQIRPLLITPPPPIPVAGGPVMDVSGMNERQYQLVRSFLQRRDALKAPARQQIAAEVAAVIRPVVRTSDPAMSNEVLLERVATAYQARFSTRTE